MSMEEEFISFPEGKGKLMYTTPFFYEFSKALTFKN